MTWSVPDDPVVEARAVDVGLSRLGVLPRVILDEAEPTGCPLELQSIRKSNSTVDTYCS